MISRALPVPFGAADVTVYPEASMADGRLLTVTDRDGSGWHAVSVVVHGQRGAIAAWLDMTPGQARHLAASLTLSAAWVDAREHGKPGPCLCHAWGHGPLTPCRAEAAPDAEYCRDCWSPENGTQGLEPYHGVPKRGPHPYRHPSTALNGACLDCGEYEEDGPHANDD